jgi:8-oxo-dGTP pyrophosphatase MutT (NUDIX family)
VLLVRHTYGEKNWEVPGGGSHDYESPPDAVVREVREETGLSVEVDRLTGVYYQFEGDGFREMLHFMFECHPTDSDGSLRADLEEVDACAFWPLDDLPRPISDFTIRRIHDARGPLQGEVGLVRSRRWIR